MSRYHFLCVVCALVISPVRIHGTLAEAATEDSCILSFVVPRDMVKSSCQINEKVNRQLSAIEMKMNLYKQQVSDTQAQLIKQRQLYNEKLETLERQVHSLNARTTHIVVQLEGRGGEQDLDQSSSNVRQKVAKTPPEAEGGRSTSNILNSVDSGPYILPNIIKSAIKSQVSELLSNFTKNVETYINERIFLYHRVFNILPRTMEVSAQKSQHFVPSKLRTSVARDKLSTKDNALLQNNPNLKTKLNYTSDKIEKNFDSHVNNITKVGYTEVSEHSRFVVTNEQKKEYPIESSSETNARQENLFEHKQPRSVENASTNDTSLENPFTSYLKDVLVSASSRMSQHIIADNSSTESGSADSDRPHKWKTNTYHEQHHNTVSEVEEKLKGEVALMLYTSLAEIVNLIEEQKATFEAKITLQDARCVQLSTDLTVHREEVENSLKATSVDVQALSVDLKNLVAKGDRIQALETLVDEIKSSMIANRSANLIEHDEQNKKMKKVERLLSVYQHSMEHYRNETKHEYRELKDSLDKEAKALWTFSSNLHSNVTEKVRAEINRLNISYMARFHEINDQIRSHEDSLLNVQADIQKTEKLLQNRPKRSDRDIQDLQVMANDLDVRQKDLKKTVDSIEQIQSAMNGTMNVYLQEVSGLKTEVKLSYHEWLPLTFEFDSSRTDCFGDQYVKRTHYSKTRLVGVILCSPTRYKIFLSTSLQNTFWNIGDGHGMGEDHCEFVGGNKDWNVKLSPFKPSFEAVQGYARNHWGQEPVVAYLNAIKPSPHWYECGVKVP